MLSVVVTLYHLKVWSSIQKLVRNLVNVDAISGQNWSATFKMLLLLVLRQGITVLFINFRWPLTPKSICLQTTTTQQLPILFQQYHIIYMLLHNTCQPPYVASCVNPEHPPGSGSRYTDLWPDPDPDPSQGGRASSNQHRHWQRAHSLRRACFQPMTNTQNSKEPYTNIIHLLYIVLFEIVEVLFKF